MKSRNRDTFWLYVGMLFRELWRDPLTAFFGLVFPVFFLLFVGLSTTGRAYLFPVAIVTPNHERASGLVRSLAELKTVQVTEMNDATAQSALLKGDVSAIYRVPLEPGGAQTVGIVATAGNLDFATVVLRAARDEGNPTPSGFSISTGPAKKGEITQLAFAFPGILALALLQLGIFATALPLLRAREQGVLLHLSLTPFPRPLIIASAILVRMLIACVQIAVICTIAVVFLHVQLVGNLFLFGGLLALGTAMMIAFGYALAGLARSYDSGLIAIMLTNFAMMFLGQVFWDTSQNHTLAPLVRLIPMTYITDGLRTLALGANGMMPLWADAALTLGWLVLAIIVATRTFRFDLSER